MASRDEAIDRQAAAQSRDYEGDKKKAAQQAEDGYRIGLRAGTGASDDQTQGYLARLMQQQADEGEHEFGKLQRGMKEQFGEEVTRGENRLTQAQQVRVAQQLAERIEPLQFQYREAHAEAMKRSGNHTSRQKYIDLMDSIATELYGLGSEPTLDD
jgi:hypothetical protein